MTSAEPCPFAVFEGGDDAAHRRRIQRIAVPEVPGAFVLRGALTPGECARLQDAVNT